MSKDNHDHTLDAETFLVMQGAWGNENHSQCKECIAAMVEPNATRIAKRVMQKGKLTRAVIEEAVQKAAFEGAMVMEESIIAAYHLWYHANHEGDCHTDHVETEEEIEELHHKSEAQAMEAYRLAYNKFVEVDIAEAKAAGGAVDMDLIEDNARQAAADIYREKYDTCMGYLEPTDPDPDFSIAARRRVFRKFAPEPAPLPHASHLRLA